MKTKFKIIISMALIITILGGCSTFMQKGELNQRQIAILEKEGKPTKWSKLQSYEKQSIQTIEEMLVYLENKYNKEFCYGYFKMADFITGEPDSLLAYAKGDDPETDLFEVHKEDEKFVDDYGLVLAEPKFHAEVENAVANLLSGYNHEIYTYVGTVDENNSVIASTVVLIIEKNEKDDYLDKALADKVFSLNGTSELDVHYVTSAFLDGVTKKNWEHRGNEIIESYFISRKEWEK